MAYSELIKNFSRIRVYLRSFYVYGFRHRNEFTQKSARSYDNERRRVESWLGEYMSFGQDAEGRRVFLSVDSRAIQENPLYRAFRTKSFTDRDITLHFHILDILKVMDGLSITEIMDQLSDRLSEFENDELPDESTIRKKLREYTSLGLIETAKRGRETIYVLSEDHTDLASWSAAAAFFSEAAPLGVAGSFLQDRLPEKFRKFRFKHHYILNALDSEILYELFTAIGESRLITFTARKQRTTALPLKVYIGTQTGRQYLLAWSPVKERFFFFRADMIDSVKRGDIFSLSDALKKNLEDFQSHAWGVTGNNNARLEHIEMTVFAGPDEGHIVERLEREKRCGRVEKLDDRHWKFTADVHEAFEMLPWLRTFTGRITDLQCTDRRVIYRFWKDFNEMAQMYD
ncbi:MAG: WYL domain-containing protein [Eubacteriales bacterium]|nr:WYL domain-containing protein [Eubacteriales bacterium]